jgi:glucosamine-6-phosphate deaminase
MEWEILDSPSALADRAAQRMLDAVRENPRLVLGLPTGRSPMGMYDRVVAEYVVAENAVAECAGACHSFGQVTSFNLDEYVGVPRAHPASYFSYMRQHFLDHVDIDPAHAHIPDGMASDPAAECRRYEAEICAAGGLDLTFLGLGRNGHIGFNEPGTPFGSRTRLVELTQSTRRANADAFPDGNVPTHAITMGIGTILESRRIVLLVSGSGKERAIERLRSGRIDEDFPASALWEHGDVRVLWGWD